MVNRLFPFKPRYNVLFLANSRAWKVSPEKTVLVFLWYAGHHSASFIDVSDRFNVCLRTMYDIISRMIDFIETLSAVIEWLLMQSN